MDKVLDIKTETVDKVTYLIMNSELMETFGDIVGELYSNTIYNELIDLLGDRSGLVTEFVDNYRACNFMLFSLINC